MKIFNYSDKPVVIGGVPTHEHVIYINNSMQRHIVTHNNKQFLNPHSTTDRNIIYSINNHPNGSYDYREQNLSVPDVWLWVSIFITFFGFYFVTRILQKIKLS